MTTQPLEMGIDSTRNDNNETSMRCGTAGRRCYSAVIAGREIAIKHIRPVMPLLMRASLEAQQRFAPQKRPYLISRSGCAGCSAVQTAGAATTAPTGIRCAANTRMGLGMSLSGLFNARRP